MKFRLVPLALALALGGVAAPAFAQQAGEWTISVGAHQVNPKSDNGTLTGGLEVEVGSNVRPTITAEYFFRDNLGVEVLASWPFEHDINVKGLGNVGSTKHLPPTVTLQYHFGNGTVKPFVGAVTEDEAIVRHGEPFGSGGSQATVEQVGVAVGAPAALGEGGVEPVGRAERVQVGAGVDDGGLR